MILLFGIAIYMILSGGGGSGSRTSHHPCHRPVMGLLRPAYQRDTDSGNHSVYPYLQTGRVYCPAATGAAWLAAFVVFSWKMFHHLLPSYYLFHLNLSPGHSIEAIFGDLISPSRELFIYTPGAAFGLFLVWYYWRKLSHRSLAILSLITAVFQLFVIATDPTGGAVIAMGHD